MLRVGRYGPYVERGDERASVPEDMAPDELTVEKAEELLSAPTGDRVLGTHPEWDREIVGQDRPLRPVRDRGARGGRDREAAHRLALQVDVARDGHARGGGAAALAAAHARRRPGRRRGDRRRRTAATARTSRRAPRSRSLESEEQLFTITLERGARAARAAEAAARPRRRRSRRCASSGPIRSAASRSWSRKADSART